jgi:hypothetical protein
MEKGGIDAKRIQKDHFSPNAQTTKTKKSFYFLSF